MIFPAPSENDMQGFTIHLWNGFDRSLIFTGIRALGRLFEYQPDSNGLRLVSQSRRGASRLSLVQVLLSFCIHNYKSRKVVIVSYPNFPKSLLLAILLLFLRPLRVIVIVDVQDLALPREKRWTMSYLVWWLVNELFYFYAHFIVNASECAKLYSRRARGMMIVIPWQRTIRFLLPGEYRQAGVA